MSDNAKRHLLSAAVTFLTAFLVAIAPGIGDVQFTSAGLFALLLVGARAGVKAFMEWAVGRNF